MRRRFYFKLYFKPSLSHFFYSVLYLKSTWMRYRNTTMDDSVVSITSPGPAGAGGVRSPAATTNEIKPYKIHVSVRIAVQPLLFYSHFEQVSFRYLDLTKKKLELTRLPHELLLPQSREWEHGTPKSEIEPLVDYW